MFAMTSSSTVFSFFGFLLLIWPVVRFINSGTWPPIPDNCFAKSPLAPASFTRPEMLALAQTQLLIPIWHQLLRRKNLNIPKSPQTSHIGFGRVPSLVVLYYLLHILYILAFLQSGACQCRWNQEQQGVTVVKQGNRWGLRVRNTRLALASDHKGAEHRKNR